MTRQDINRAEIHKLWNGLIQDWKSVWLAVQDHARWQTFIAGCEGLHAFAQTQQIPEIESALAPLIQMLDGTPQFGEAEKIAVHRLLPSVFNAVREACTDDYRRTEENENNNAAALPLIVILSARGDSLHEISTQIDYYGYALKIVAEPHEALQIASQQNATAVIIDLPKGIPNEYESLIEALNRQGTKWFALNENGGFSLRLQAVRLGAQGFFIQPLTINTLIDAVDPIAYKANDEPYRVLLLDDSMTVLASIKKTLKSFPNINLRTLRQADRILETLQEFSPDVLLLDFHMENCTGLEVAKIIRQNKAFESIPLVYLTSETNEEIQLEAMRHGGDDFLTKPIGKAQLVNSVMSRAERYRGLRKLMVEDSLTGLYNHGKTKSLLQQAMLFAERRQASVCYTIIDIDHFKRVNDTYGHSIGDKVLKSLARLLKQRVRRADVVGRYGGEEFAIVLFDSNPSDALDRINSIRQAFAELQHGHDGGSFTCTFSAGIAHYPAYTEQMALMVAADDALYESKRAGRNCVTLAAQSK